MKRALVLGGLIAIGGLSLAAYQPPQQRSDGRRSRQDQGDNLWVLKGGGGNTAVFLTGGGVVVVDAKNPGWGKPILDKIKELTPKPISMLINTHTHGDHVSGNVEFPATVDVIAQENTKANMEKMDIFKQNNNRGMAKRTFKGQDDDRQGRRPDRSLLLRSGPHQRRRDRRLSRHCAPRTSAICSPARVCRSSTAPTAAACSTIDETLNKVHSGVKNVDTIINGHMPNTTTWADLKTFAEFNHDFLTWAQGALKSGKSAEDAAKEWKVPDSITGYSSTVAPLFGGLPGRLTRLQEEMKK